ncbi:MAG TPA: acetoin utilization protein AcuC [Ktedonobacteraceae bacterium]|nr:acetoin utilization protein AcuC [Ktedonobacteraceae bacterium]
MVQKAEALTPARARFMFDTAELNYDFGPEHPLQARRLVALIDLLETCGLWSKSNQNTLLPPRAATRAELELVHTPDYIEAVQKLSEPADLSQLGPDELHSREHLALDYGFAEGDTPPLPGMHEVASLIAGGSLVGLSAIMGLPAGGEFAGEDERPLRVFHPAGGLHHAWPARASGFCVYNDAAIAIAHVLRSTEARVLYLDFDAHHGDGVQKAFYDEPRVMTISLHETGRYLFPGTGDVLEMGQGLGRGYSVNLPLQPFTEDDSYIEVMEALLPPLLVSFAPDVLVTVHGCDTHAWDPLTHLSLTTRGIDAQIKLARQLADTYCQGRWLALGGGGYDLYRVVPRAWSMVWARMSGQALPEKLPEAWVERWRPAWLKVQEQEAEEQQVMGKQISTANFPLTFEDRSEDIQPQPRRWEISHTNRSTAALARHLLLSSSLRQAFRRPRRVSPMTGLVDLLHLRGTYPPSRSKLLKTAKGPVLLRDFCPPSMVERLRADEGLRAFARLPEREWQLLLNIARSPDCALTLAHTPAGEIVGEVTIAPGDEWWDGLDDVYEVAIEVSSNWRGLRLATQLLAFALELDALEDMILFAVGLSWHWDTEGLHMSMDRYRELITRLFASQGFVEYPTTEPNVRMEPANVFLARIGKRVDARASSRFLSRVMSAPTLSFLL